MTLVAGLVAMSVPVALPYIFREIETTPVPSNRRTVLRRDPVEHALVTGTPYAGPWTKAAANAEGWFEGRAFSGGYARATIDWPRAETVLLDAVGHSLVYVNGEPRAGDVYGYGYVSLPVSLKAGKNEFLFVGGRGRLRAQLSAVPAPASLDLRDPTLPDFRVGEKGDLWGAVIVRNATPAPMSNLRIRCAGRTTSLPSVPALSVRKVPFRIPRPATGSAEPELPIELRLGQRVLDRQSIKVRVREPNQTYKRTFISEIDGSLQYYAVNPSSNPGSGQALFLSLHGASVEAIGQADAYAPKTWGHLVAPTNRRPYGFDWEEVGRLDALEVLAHAEKELKTDPRKTYLTGHSMGGHGTWQVGVHFPSLFAAIAPCAGWISFATYGGGGTYRKEGIEGIFARASSPSDTLAMKHNYASVGVYVLHGDADSTVPVSEARTMRQELAGIAPRLLWHEEKGQGHWYDTTPEAGADCVDWPPIFDLFATSRVPAARDLREIDFTTMNPGNSASHHWATVEQQEKPYAPSRIRLTADPHRGAFRGTTENVSFLTLRADPLVKRDRVTLEIDSQVLIADKFPIHLRKVGGKWSVSEPLPAQEKGSHRNGGFKDVFRNRVLFVYGTAGSTEENAWAYAKARFDAESFWYRGNAAVDVVPDDSPLLRDKDRNVLLYGNEATNRAWKSLVGSEVAVRAGRVGLGSRMLQGDDLAVLAIVPRQGSERASVAVVAPTGRAGAKLLERVPYFTPGAALPDVTVLLPGLLVGDAKGVAVAGFFGNDWSAAKGEWAWSE